MRVNPEGASSANDRIERDTKSWLNTESQTQEIRIKVQQGPSPMVSVQGPNFSNSSVKNSVNITPFFGDG